MNRFRCKQVESVAVLGFKKLAKTFFTDAVEKSSHIFEPFLYEEERGKGCHRVCPFRSVTPRLGPYYQQLKTEGETKRITNATTKETNSDLAELPNDRCLGMSKLFRPARPPAQTASKTDDVFKIEQFLGREVASFST